MSLRAPSEGRTHSLECKVGIAFAFFLSLVAQMVSGASIDNQAAAQYRELATGYSIPLQSNVVAVQTQVRLPRIRFFTNASYSREAVETGLRSQLFIEADVYSCNRDPNVVEEITILTQSMTSHDWENHVATETGPNSGVFRSDQAWTTEEVVDVSRHLSSKLEFEPGPGDENSMLETAPDDILQTSTDGCGGGAVEDTILVDPAGYLFDSETNEPVVGASVRLIDVTGEGNGGHPGQDAVVFADDDATPAPSEVVTDAMGLFSFPLVSSSTYRLVVAAPKQYILSKKAPGALPRNRRINLPGSFGGDFVVNEATGAVLLDIPLDPLPRGLSVQKTVSQSSAEVTDSVQYTITVRNVSTVDLEGVTVTDRLPVGFRYVYGTTRLEGTKVADPAGSQDVNLAFEIGALAAGDAKKLTYRTLIGPGALQGDGINRAQASSRAPTETESNVASAKVDVEAGVFDDRAFILGKVFADCNANSTKDPDERGLADIRIYLEDGTFVVTDTQGNYSFYGISPRTHALKVDPVTLPAGVKLQPLSHRNAGAGDSLFIDAKRGELVRADFATQDCANTAIETLTQQRAPSTELTRSLTNELKTATAAVADARALPASGTIDALHATTATAALPAVEHIAAALPLEQLATTMTNRLEFIGLKDGDRIGSRQLTIRVKGLAGSQIALFVNETEVAADRVGTRVVNDANRATAFEFVGVALQAGANELTLTQKDGFGNLRGTETIHVTAAGELARIVVRPQAERASADGTSLAALTVTLEDAKGTPVETRLPVTLETTAGEWQVADLDANAPGIQTFLDSGSTKLMLRAPGTAGDAEVRVVGDSLSGRATVSFLPALRPLLGLGIVEGTLSLNKLSLKSISPARADDGFEEELSAIAGGGSKDQIGTRAALFLKGKVKGDYLLTLGVDSEKDARERLFRDIDPDQFYPVYGDSSTKGFDAQSTSRLYVRVDKEKSYFLAGDFTTQSIEAARNLGAYQRSLNGVKEHFENGVVTANVFASRDSTRQIIDELPGNGTSGPYPLEQNDVIENSEKVEILTRDRNQPDVIISSLALTRFADYEIDTFTGRLVFRAPVPSLDADLNRISIRITYEVDQGGEQFWVSGVDAQVKVTERLTLGGSAVEDANPQDGQRLRSINGRFQIDTSTTATVELADSDTDSHGSGTGERVEIRHESQAFKARLFAGRTSEEFYNRSATLSAGRQEGGLKTAYVLDERTRLIADALHSSDVTTEAKRYGALVGIERKVGEQSKVEAGFRQVNGQPAAADSEQTKTTSFRIKGTTPLPGVEKATMYGEYEQDVTEQDKRLAAVGGDYRLTRNSRIYLRHELISSLTGPYDLDTAVRRNATVLGIDTSYREDNRVFSEYRVGNAMSSREAEAAIGLRNRWTLADGLRANTSLEKVDALSGSGETESTAIAGSLDYTRNPLWKGTTRLELRRTESSDTLFSTFGLGWQFADDWALLAKNVLAVTDYDNAQADRLQERLRVGVAYRDNATNLVNALARYEFRRETGTAEIGAARTVHMLSIHANRQIAPEIVISGEYATKYSLETVDGEIIRGHAHLVAGRITRDFGKRWDMGLAVRNLFSGEFSANQYGFGVEAGYLVMDNLWVSAGYNVVGFYDKDLSADEYTREGAFIRMRFKFDEILLGKL